MNIYTVLERHEKRYRWTYYQQIGLTGHSKDTIRWIKWVGTEHYFIGGF